MEGGGGRMWGRRGEKAEGLAQGHQEAYDELGESIFLLTLAPGQSRYAWCLDTPLSCREPEPVLQATEGHEPREWQSPRRDTLCARVLSGSVVSNSVTPWTVARQAPLCMGFSSKESWSGFPFATPEDLPDSVTEPRLLH